MAFIYGVLLGSLSLIMWYADRPAVRIATLLVCGIASLIFGGLAERGIQ